MTDKELKTLKHILDKQLASGFISPSIFSHSAPMSFVKQGGKLRLLVDYRVLNSNTPRNEYPVPLVIETLSRLSKAKIFTKLDLRARFNNIHIRKGDEWKTAFMTPRGLYLKNLMPFGLVNAPAVFQKYVNETLFERLGLSVSAYFGDITVFSERKEERFEHVRCVLEKLFVAGCRLRPAKCQWGVDQLE